MSAVGGCFQMGCSAYARHFDASSVRAFELRGCSRLPERGWYGLRVAGRRIMMDAANLLIPLLCYANGAGGI